MDERKLMALFFEWDQGRGSGKHEASQADLVTVHLDFLNLHDNLICHLKIIS